MPSCIGCCSNWRGWIRPLLIIFYIIVLIIAVPLLVVEFNLNDVNFHLQGWFVAGIFVLMTIPISLWSIIQHMVHYTQPFLQRHIIRILWMVPIYSVNAWFGLRFVKEAMYLDTCRECYEAYVIYNFMAYLLGFLRSEYPDLEDHIEQKDQQKHIFPMCCFPSWKMGTSIISKCKHGVLQYTVIRPVTTIIALICQTCGVYSEGEFTAGSAWLYLTFINNCSQVWAMYCLVLFYYATKEEIAPIRPISKFLCVKAVVFMSFWQSVLIAGLVAVGVLNDEMWKEFTATDVATGLQDFLICIEMFLASLAHYYSFSHAPYVDYAQGYASCFQSFKAMLDVSDVGADVVGHVRHVGQSARNVVQRGRAPATDNERQPLLQDTDENTSSHLPEKLKEDIADVLKDAYTDSEELISGLDDGPINVHVSPTTHPEDFDDRSLEVLLPGTPTTSNLV